VDGLHNPNNTDDVLTVLGEPAAGTDTTGARRLLVRD
jgi:hypothetical protein